MMLQPGKKKASYSIRLSSHKQKNSTEVIRNCSQGYSRECTEVLHVRQVHLASSTARLSTLTPAFNKTPRDWHALRSDTLSQTPI